MVADGAAAAAPNGADGGMKPPVKPAPVPSQTNGH
jgi:hypothetical protein